MLKYLYFGFVLGEMRVRQQALFDLFIDSKMVARVVLNAVWWRGEEIRKSGKC